MFNLSGDDKMVALRIGYAELMQLVPTDGLKASERFDGQSPRVAGSYVYGLRARPAFSRVVVTSDYPEIDPSERPSLTSGRYLQGIRS
jgi:hypothetical protein